jgi:hypothetical protein
MTDLICVDAAAQDDLMLWDQLARGVLEKAGRGDRMLILVGSGESQERRLEVIGQPTRRHDGALTVIDDSVSASMRESVRTVTNRLTDEGVYAVGMLAAERGLVRAAGDALTCSQRFASRVWTGPGVVPVLGCFVAGETSTMLDVHPLLVAHTICKGLGDQSRIVMLARRKTVSLAAALEADEQVSRTKLLEEGAFHPQLPELPEEALWHASHVTEIASSRAAKVR